MQEKARQYEALTSGPDLPPGTSAVSDHGNEPVTN